jgi:hypothetical protein
MEDVSSRITTIIKGYIDILLVVLGQALIIFVISGEGVPAYLIAPALVLDAAGLAIRAKKGGRSVLTWTLMGCLFPLIFPVIAILFMIFRDRMGSRDKRPLPLYGHGIIAALLFLIGAVLMDSFSFAFFSTIAAIIWVLAGKRGSYTWKQRVVQVMIYLAAFAMVLGAKTVNNQVSARNAGVIIAACDQYLTKNAVYPESLKDLVPAYLPKVPPARYTWMSGNFWYHRDRVASGNRYSLMYTVEAPFARRIYSSERKTWRSID